MPSQISSRISGSIPPTWIAIWIHFCLTFALAQEASFKTDTVLWSNEQIIQQVLPELQGDSQALTVQIETKRAFFNAEGTYEEAFWQWQSEDVMNIDVLNALRISILSKNQQRLQLPLTRGRGRTNKKPGITFSGDKTRQKGHDVVSNDAMNEYLQRKRKGKNEGAVCRWGAS